MNRHIAGLDALRTLAIVGVTFFHMFPEQVVGGYLGVSLFFVLTGYLLAYTSVQGVAKQGVLWVVSYYGKRIRRIYPELLFMLLVTVGACHFLAPDAIAAVRPEVLSVLGGYNNWWQIAQNADYFTRITNASPFTHLWFLGIELQYYLIWPLIFGLYLAFRVLCGARAAASILLFLGAISAALMPLGYVQGMDITRLYYGTDMRIDALLFGAGVGLWQAEERRRRRYAGTSSMFNGALGAGLFTLLAAETAFMYFLLDGQSPYLYEGGMLLMTMAFVGMVAILGAGEFALADVLEMGVFRWIGQKSYGLFLWQYPVIYLFHVRGWDALPLYGILELAIIVVLAIWSSAAADAITRLRLPVRGRFALPRAATFLAASLCALVFMGFGCQGIALSASSKAPDTALRAQLAANAATQQAENEKSAKEAAEREAAKKAAERAAQEQERMAQVDLSGAVCIGDSVMLGASPAIRQVLPGCYIDAEVSRYVGGGLEVTQSLAAQGRLGNIVVIALGTNGPIAGAERYAVQTNELLEYLGPNRHIFWVNVYCPKLTWQQTNNDCIRDMPIAHPNVTVVDWYRLVKDHPEWLTSDGIHPNDEGIKAYANLIHDTIAKTLAKE